jgi:hypothetical protein
MRDLSCNAGKLNLSARRCRDGGLVIEVADDGFGLSEGFDSKNGKSSARYRRVEYAGSRHSRQRNRFGN